MSFILLLGNNDEVCLFVFYFQGGRQFEGVRVGKGGIHDGDVRPVFGDESQTGFSRGGFGELVEASVFTE